MTGDVWEWTSTLYRMYPYQTDDDRDNLDANGERMVRGGRRMLASLACVVLCNSVSGNENLGFHVVLSP